MQNCPRVGRTRGSGRVTILPDFGGSDRVGSGRVSTLDFLSAIADLINVSPGQVGSKKSDPWTTLIRCVSSVLQTYLNYEMKTPNHQAEHFTHCDQSHAKDFHLCVTNSHCNNFMFIILYSAYFQPERTGTAFRHFFLDKYHSVTEFFLKRNAPERRFG